MKRGPFIAVCIGTQVILIVLHLHKQSKSIQLSYKKQKFELEKEYLLKKRQELSHQLYTLHDPINVKQFAQEKLGLKPVNLSQVKRLDHGQPNS